MDFKKHCKVVFGSYVKSHDDPKLTNNIKPRTNECIYLEQTINLQGTQKVFCIDMVRVLTIIKVIPMLAPY